MADVSFLIVRLGSLGDIVHTLPAAAALRASFPQARIDWVVESKWLPLLAGNPDVNQAIPLDRSSWSALRARVGRLRAARYDCVLDFQGLYKSAVLARLTGAPKRIGWDRRYAREGGAALFYTHPVVPTAAHVVDQNLELAQSAGARRGAVRFPLPACTQADREFDQYLAAQNLRDYFVLSPDGGWRAKCWPPERYGELHRRLAERLSLRGVVNYGPGEESLAEAVRSAAGQPEPVLFSASLDGLLALLRGAKFFVGGDTGPLHLAVALGTPVIGLYGPTDPARNGPYSKSDVVIRNAGPDETTYRRGDDYSPSMLSITVGQVAAAIKQRMGKRG